nr:hypothetical protein [Tanacetum cinerariifolium]
MEEEKRIAREKDKENRSVIEEWDDVQATIDADRVNTFVAMDSEVMEGLKKTQAEVTEGSKRAGDEIEQESAKRQRLEKKDDTTYEESFIALVCLELI